MTKDEALKMALDEQIEWIDGWAKAYPESIFPPVTEEESQALEEFKKHLGMRIAAQMGRHIGKQFEEVIKTLNACKEALEQEERTQRTMYCGTADAFIAMDDDHKRRWFVQSLRESKRRKELEDILAQPAQEPVALKFPTMLRKMWSGGEVQEWLDKQQSLYTHPAPAREALSEKAIVEAMSKADITAYGDAVAFNKRIMKLARAIEQAHGIGS